MAEEQITIQVGSFSNYVGTHFWNFQDDIFGYCTNENEDCNELKHEEDHSGGGGGVDEDRQFCQFSQLFRSGQINGRDVSTPRAVIIDRRGALGSLNPMAAFDPNSASSTTQPAIDTWDQNKTSIFREDMKEKNSFLRMLEQHDNYYQDAQEISYDKYGRIIEKEVENDSEAHQEEEDDDKESDGDGLLKDSDVHAWSDYLKVHLHPTSVVELPFWSFNEPFSTFAAGMSRSVIGDDHRCDYFDKIRKFAEECDYLRNITVLADLYDGFGGLTCSLMEEIRDEFPRMTVPVWGFTESEDSAVTSLQHDLENETLGSLVIPLYNVPLCYSSLAELASVVIPINPHAALEASPFMRPKASMPYHTAAVIAGALELTTGYHRIYDTRMSNTSLTKGFSDWAQSVTCNGRFKFCNVEMKMPFPFDLANSMTGDTSLSKPLLPLWATYDATLRMPTAYSMNPFMKSLSASVYGQWSADPKFLKKEREAKPYSNVLTIRGSRSGDLPQNFFRHCLGTKNLVSHVHQRSLGLPIPNSFPSFFHGMDRNGLVTLPRDQPRDASAIANVLLPQSNCSVKQFSSPFSQSNEPQELTRASYLNGMASIGCDGATMGHHLANVRECWSRRPHRAKMQLGQVGMTADDCNEVQESLIQLEECYTSR